MDLPRPPLDLLRCPRCKADLRSAAGGYECAECRTDFPQQGVLPCLFPEPTRTVTHWQREGQRFSELIDESVASMDEHLRRTDLLPISRTRLERTRQAHAENGQRLANLFRKAGLFPEDRVKASDSEFSLIEYYDQILRDWAWEEDGAAENRIACDLVADKIGSHSQLGRVLVLGAGPCRLAYDLHQRFAPELTVALDINPLLLLAAAEVMFEGGMKLFEFPPDPTGLAAVCVDRTLSAPQGPPERFHLVWADAFSAPLRPGAFDTVLTPWFIDIVPTDIRDTLSLIFTLLKPGGRWLNYGPLSYPQGHNYGQRYSYDELYQLVSLATFEMSEPTITSIEYMRSKYAARGKSADVLTFSARKPSSPAPVPESEPPAWLLLSHLPVPRFAGLDSHKPDHPLLGYLAGLIDGKRSIADFAERMIKDHGARPDAAVTGTRAMLALLRENVRQQ